VVVAFGYALCHARAAALDAVARWHMRNHGHDNSRMIVVGAA
jgi:hypothetical protein